MTAKWGIDLPSSNLFYVLIIIISGILINTRFAIIVTVVIGLTMSIIGYLQHTNVLFINNYWKQRDWSTSDIVMTIIVYIIIATVSWLSNREIEKSLVRAQKSEAELKKERDSLAEIVKQKTKEIRAEQAEKISQFYRFAEIGRLSSGLFHDLISPLTSLSLNIEKIKTVNPEEVKPYLDRSILMVKKMDEFITSVRKQIIKQENKKVFCLNEEIRQVIDILSYKILREKIEISFVADKNNIKTFGDIAKFDQIVLNLLTNAIEAYDNKKEIVKKEILVNLKEDKDYVIFTIKDYGVGISEEISNNLFEPFFTTKNFTNGLGIGLPMVKSIVEKDFLGEIKVESLENIGTKFIVKLKKYEQPIS
jgi:signal transduction histidine kinase